MQLIRTSTTRPTIPQALSDCLPLRLCEAIGRHSPQAVEELRLHACRRSFVTKGGKSHPIEAVLSTKELSEILLRMCGGSLYAYAETIRQGYLCMDGGIRVGVCGSAAMEEGRIIGVNDVTSLIARVPHALHLSARPLTDRLHVGGTLCGALIYAPPGEGKTTLLRTVAQALASETYAYRTVVVDTRGELRFSLDGESLDLSILAGYPRDIGIGIAVRSLGAQIVLCDEIGGTEDAEAILAAANCGVPLIASTHARSFSELLRRPAIQRLHRARAFELYVGIKRTLGGWHYQFNAWEESPT